MRRIVIVGNGIAGNETAFTIRKYDQRSKVTIISAENCPEYDPGALTYYVSDDLPREAVFLKNIDDYHRSNIDLLLGHKVTKIDCSEKKVCMDDDSGIDYDKLVIATGSKPVIPPIDGVDKEGVFGCKVLSDADSLVSHNGENVVVVGSGLIGIEASEALKKKGYNVYLIELLDWIMPRVFDEKPAGILANLLSKHGIDVLIKEKVLSIDGDDKVRKITTDKRELMCDTVVLATGVFPANDLALDAGLKIGKSKGIKVNERGMTNVEDVYACGDCVETQDAFTEEDAAYLQRHNALEQAEVVARNCAGDCFTYRGVWDFTRVHFFDTHGMSIGKKLMNTDNAEIIEKNYGNDYCRLISHEGKLAGVQAIGKFADNAGLLLGAMWRQDDLNEIRSQWDRIQQINSSYPWPYRILCRYLGSKKKTGVG